MASISTRHNINGCTTTIASGQMLYGEQLINGHWYDFDESTGAMQYGFVYLSKSQKWVFYDRRMGWMLYGEHPIDGAWYLLDAHTGAVQYGWQGLGGKTVWLQLAERQDAVRPAERE